MKKVLLIIIVLILSNCTSYSDHQKNGFLNKRHSTGAVYYEDITYSIVSVKDLKKARKSNDLTYVGTIEKYHLLRQWLKYAVVPGEISFIAIKRDVCLVANERAPADEQKVNGGHRSVILSDDNCRIK